MPIWHLNSCTLGTLLVPVWHPNSCTLGTLLVPVWHLNSCTLAAWCRFGTLIVERCRPGTGKLSGAVLRVCQWGAGSRKDRNTGHRNRSVSNQFGPHGMCWIQNGTVRTGLTMWWKVQWQGSMSVQNIWNLRRLSVFLTSHHVANDGQWALFM